MLVKKKYNLIQLKKTRPNKNKRFTKFDVAFRRLAMSLDFPYCCFDKVKCRKRFPNSSFFYNPVLFNGEFHSLKSERASACSVMKISVDIDGIQTGEK